MSQEIRMARDYEQTFPFCKSKISSNPYREVVTLKFTLVWDSGEIEDRAEIFTGPLFGRS